MRLSKQGGGDGNSNLLPKLWGQPCTTPIPETVLAELNDGKEVSIRLICAGGHPYYVVLQKDGERITYRLSSLKPSDGND